VQVLRILPESVFYGRHLLREGDFITSVNGQSLERLSSAECDELLAPSSTVVCIELLRKIDLNTSADGRTKTPEIKDLMTADNQLDRHHQSSSLYRHSLPDELNQNELFARSKLRLSRRSGFDHDSLIRDQEQSYQSLCCRQLRDSTGSVSSGHDLIRRKYEKEKASEPDEHTDMLELSNRVPVSRDRIENSSAIKSSKVSRVKKNSPTTPDDKSEYTVDRRTIKHAKGVRFKLSTKDRNAKENDKEQTGRDKVYSTDRLLMSGKRHKVTAADTCMSLLDLTETTSDRQVSKNFVDKPSTSVVTKEDDFSMCHDAAVVATTTSTKFSSHRNILGVQNEGFDQDSSVSSSAPTLKIYTSVISLRANGNVVLTTRVTPCNYQPFLRRQRGVSRPFQIIVMQGLTGLGIEVAAVPSGTMITGIVDGGPVDRNGNVRCEIFRNIVMIPVICFNQQPYFGLYLSYIQGGPKTDHF